MKYYLGVDLGGTNIVAGVVDEHYNIIGRGSVKTRAPRPAEEIVTSIEEACYQALENSGLTIKQMQWVGIGSPGIVNSASGEIEFANNLCFNHVPLRQIVHNRLKIATYLENDANAAAYGEVLAGGARGFKDVVAITLGTGVGGGIIINGKIYSGFNHAGAELGHVGMIYNGLSCSCGLCGCVESYCSATALIGQTKERMLQCKDSEMWKLCQGDIHAVSGRTAFDAMRLGDKAAEEVVHQYCDYLSYAINNFINMLQPEIVLIGGGISHEGDTLLDPIRNYVKERAFIKDPNKQTRIERATLGNDAGVIGAAFLGKL